jgi:hypothetical protein
MKMKEKSHLYILWTSDNPITAEKMVFMYGINALIKGWWDHVTIIIWGASAILVSENSNIQNKIKEAIKKGAHVTACKACADQLEVTPILEDLNVEVIYWGTPLTELLKNGETLITI